jgi:hypothetical protein
VVYAGTDFGKPPKCMINIEVEKWFIAEMKAPELLHKL